jgi:hypothetical protein
LLQSTDEPAWMKCGDTRRIKFKSSSCHLIRFEGTSSDRKSIISDQHSSSLTTSLRAMHDQSIIYPCPVDEHRMKS